MTSATPPILFPALKTARWAYADLAAEAKADPGVADASPNPLNDPDFCQMWVMRIAHRKRADYTFGGYMEPRDHLWRGHYHNPDLMRHTAVDYNVPASTLVVAPASSKVLRVVRDTSYGGWGGCVFFALDTPYLGAGYYLMAHLAHRGLPSPGDILERGTGVGLIGEPDENGVWFPHLHLQCFDQTIYDRYAPKLDDMDGYGSNDETINPHMPDPTALGAGLHR